MLPIVAIGNDANLLRSRGLILQTIYSPVPCLVPEEALPLLQREIVHVLVLCHTLPPLQVARFTELALEKSQGCHIVFMQRLASANSGTPKRIADLPAMTICCGPSAMHRTIQYLLDSEQLPPHA
jgi:hypothetical protein